ACCATCPSSSPSSSTRPSRRPTTRPSAISARSSSPARSGAAPAPTVAPPTRCAASPSSAPGAPRASTPSSRFTRSCYPPQSDQLRHGRLARLAHVDLAGLAHDLAELDKLRGIRPRPRVVSAAGREADRALIETIADEPARDTKGLVPQGHVVEPDRLQ